MFSRRSRDLESFCVRGSGVEFALTRSTNSWSTYSQPLSTSSNRAKLVKLYASVLPLACSVKYRKRVKPPSLIKTSAKDGSPILLWSLKTAILRTASSSLPRRSTSSAALLFSIAMFLPPIESWSASRDVERKVAEIQRLGGDLAASGGTVGQITGLSYESKLAELSLL